jgi:TPR repeat protein
VHKTKPGKNSERTLFVQACDEWDAGNLKRAFELFKLAAESGDVSSWIDLGFFYGQGLGVRKNIQKEMFWYKKAARKGDAAACTNIGIVYRHKKNFDRARFWLLKGFKRGDGDAALDLAKLYLASTKRSRIKQASKYLRLALKSKHITELSIEEATALLKQIKAKA